MVSAVRALILVLCVVALAAPVCAQEIPNWPAPATWTPAAERGSVHTMSAVTGALPFIGLTPCRLVDTRGTPGVPITGGPFAANEVRTWTFTGLCGLPLSAAAVSLNITVTNTGASPFGFVKVWPGGGTEPNVSTLNWSEGGVTESNAAVVPLGTGTDAGKINLRSGNAGSDVIVDVNGYYGGLAASSTDVFLGPNAGNTTMTGTFNTAIGTDALAANTTGSNNTASGKGALQSNTSGNANTASGFNALTSNTAGGGNTASGAAALVFNTTGNNNTASGSSVLQDNTTGNNNTASGSSALLNNTTGAGNTAIGVVALQFNVTGGNNTAIGNDALRNNTGSGNTAVGFSAGLNLTAGNNNIDIGNAGVVGESSTIRIGTEFFSTRAFLAGVRGVTTGLNDAVAIMVDSAGQLGTVSSSRRFKQDIEDMGEASQALMKLRPVTFRYKASLDPVGSREYGLIAEEVAEVFPDLVVTDKGGQAETVRYHVLVPMLLNEVQKDRIEIERDRKTIADLTARLERLEALMSESIR